MIDTYIPCTEAVQEALARGAGRVEPDGAGGWRLGLGRGSRLPAAAHLGQGWFRLETDVPRKRLKRHGGSDLLWHLLEWNRGLPGGVKFVLTPDQRVGLRAEAPVDGEADMAVRVADALAGVETGWSRLRRRGKRAHADAEGARADTTGSVEPVDLGAMCTSAGWAFTQRPDGRLAVDLDVGDGFRQACVESRDRDTRVSTMLARAETLDPASRHAWSVLLLSASGLVRMGRTTVTEEDGVATATFEVAFAPAPCAVELRHALCVCSVACRVCAREVEQLRDPEVAAAYLAVRGCTAEPDDEVVETE